MHLPLSLQSVIRQVVVTQQVHVGPVASGDPHVDTMLQRCGGAVPATALILPLIIKNRVVSLLLAHRGPEVFGFPEVSELLPLGQATAAALGRLIVDSKQGSRAGLGPVPTLAIGSHAAALVQRVAQAALEPGAVRPQVLEGDPLAPVSGSISLPPRRPHMLSGPLPQLETIVSSLPPPSERTVGELLDEIERAPESKAEAAIGAAIARVDEVLPELWRRFPGAQHIDRFSVADRPLRAAQYGGLLELVVRLGPRVSEVLIEKMQAPQRDLRFFATVCIAELRPRDAVLPLIEGLFDHDFGVRACAITALAGYPSTDLQPALLRARQTLHGDFPDRAVAAANALAELRDRDAIGDLVTMLKRGGRHAEAAHRALVALSRQDFGLTDKKWQTWWEDNGPRHRVEWLIDALAHKEDVLRQAAIEELRALTGQDLGYVADAPKLKRVSAIERWQIWWSDDGRQRCHDDSTVG